MLVFAYSSGDPEEERLVVLTWSHKSLDSQPAGMGMTAQEIVSKMSAPCMPKLRAARKSSFMNAMRASFQDVPLYAAADQLDQAAPAVLMQGQSSMCHFLMFLCYIVPQYA